MLAEVNDALDEAMFKLELVLLGNNQVTQTFSVSLKLLQ